jgi:hypothetical protein
MQEVAIIGAGELGGAVAHALARSNLVRSVRLIDETGRVAAGKALDIAEAAPIEGFATRLSGGTDVSMAAGAQIVVIADRIAGGEWHGEDGLLLLKRLAQTASGSVIVCAGASQRELVDRGVRELKFSRARLFGSAPESLAAAARADRVRFGDCVCRSVSARARGSRRPRTQVLARAIIRVGTRVAGRCGSRTHRAGRERIAARRFLVAARRSARTHRDRVG